MNDRCSILVINATGKEAASLGAQLAEPDVELTVVPDGFKALAVCKLRSPDMAVFIDCEKGMQAKDFYARVQSDPQTSVISVLLAGQELTSNKNMICFPQNAGCSALVVAIRLMLRERRFSSAVKENEAEVKDLQLTEKNTNFKRQRFIREFINMEILQCQRYGMPMSLIMVLPDKANLEKNMGIPVDTEVLYEHLSVIIYKICRISDQIVRLPNDELAVFLPSTLLDGAVDLAERLRSTLEGCTFVFNNFSSYVTASLGVSMLDKNDTDARKLMAYAQSAMHKAIQSGGNITMVAEQELS